MIDAMTRKPLRVCAADTDWPYIIVPFSRLGEIRQLFDSRGIRYWVSEHAISLDGGPETIAIDFGRGGDAAAVQAALDSVQ